jgi:Calx-beta domain-containing protein
MRHSLPTLVSVIALATVALAVVSAPVAAQVTQPTIVTFSYVGGPQSFTVPEGVTEVEIVACGAQGDDDGGTYPLSLGGRGGGGGLVGGEGEGRDDRFGGVQGRGGTATAGGAGGRGSWDVGTSGTLGQGGQGPGGGGGGSGLGDSFVAASCVGSGVVTISLTPAPPVPVVIPGATTVVEGESGTTLAEVPVSLSHTSQVPVTVDWVTVDHAATAPEDHVAATGTVTFAPGDTDAFVPVTINADLLHENDEILLVSFRNPTNATIGGFYGLGAVTIIDDDPAPVAVPLIGFALEGDVGVGTIDVPVVLSAPSGLPVALDWTTYDITATSPDDYVSASGTLAIDAGATTGVVTIVVNGDCADEPVEAFLIGFTNPRGAVLGGF